MTGVSLRVGFAGANAIRGWARDAHLAAVRAIPGLTIIAVSARDRSIADTAATFFGAPKAYDDSLAMARDPDIDIVAVTVKVPEHRAIVLAALDSGKHVYCEWPLGRDIAETEEMAAAARTAKGHCAIGLQANHAPAVRHAEKLMRDGAIGRPLTLRVVSATAGWGEEALPFHAYLQDKRNGATLATIAGGHTLAAIETVVGAYTDVVAQTTVLRGQVRIVGTEETVERTCPDHMLVSGRHESGCTSSLEVIGGVADMPLVFELRGTRGMLSITGHHPGGFQAADLTVTTSTDSVPQSAPVVPGLGATSINVAECWTAFIADIHDGRHTVPDFGTGVRLTRLLDAIDVSSTEGRRVAVGDPEYG